MESYYNLLKILIMSAKIINKKIVYTLNDLLKFQVNLEDFLNGSFLSEFN